MHELFLAFMKHIGQKLAQAIKIRIFN